MFDRYTGLSKVALSCITLISLSSPAFAQREQKYPLDVEILSSSSSPMVTNLRQNATVKQIIVNVGTRDAKLDPQPEMICPTAKSPTIQEWSTQSMPRVTRYPAVIHRAIAPAKPQTVARQTAEPITHGSPVSVASAYPFNTGSRSYTIASKTNSHHSALR